MSSGGKDNVFAHGSSQDFETIAQFICDRLNDRCRPADGYQRCPAARDAAKRATRGQAVINAFLNAMEPMATKVVVVPSPTLSPQPGPKQSPDPKPVPSSTVPVVVTDAPSPSPTNTDGSSTTAVISETVTLVKTVQTSITPVPNAVTPPMGTEPEETRHWRWTALIIGSLILLLTFATLGLSYRLQEYPPMRAKQLNIITLALLATTFWWIGQNQSLGLFDDVPLFSSCWFWSIFVQFVLGIQLHAFVFTLRMLRLFFIFVWQEKPHCPLFWFILIVFQIPVWIMALLPLGLPDKLISVYGQFDGVTMACQVMSDGYIVMLYVAIAAQILFLTYITYKVSKVSRVFSEFFETAIAISIAVFFLAMTFILYVAGGYNTIGGKIFLSLSTLIAAVSLFWATLGPVLYGYYFRYDEYLEKWLEDFSHFQTAMLQTQRFSVKEDLSKLEAVYSNRMSSRMSAAPSDIVLPGSYR
ncbi:hypothetical protein EDD86DRAFT_216664 [Gorgonomyces haynaldii]|nr:hypothetical protein EDD86DRAFT_216664 [Gorgonomyces haynaldii]